jgi:hypothetical protein
MWSADERSGEFCLDGPDRPRLAMLLPDRQRGEPQDRL